MIKLVVFAPTSCANIIRKVMSEAGAGKIGNYDSVSFSSKGVGRFRPLKGARPSLGSIGELEEVEEERIEVLVSKEKLKNVITKMEKVHPYEKPAYDIIPLLNDEGL